jgi:endonuclease YncB( thermonuclease family)
VPNIPIFLPIVLLWLIPAAGEASGREPARVIRVISGDILTVQYQQKWEELQLLGIDSPVVHFGSQV